MKKIYGDIILLYINVYHKWRSHDIQFLKYEVRQTETFIILDHFLPFQPPDNPENKNFKFGKNTWRYYHFTHLYHKWQSYNYGSWDMEHNRKNFLSFWTIFCPFNTQKVKILNKWKKTPEDIIILQTCTKNNSHMMYGSWNMECNGQISSSFWTIFCPFTHLTTWKIKILNKMKKMPRYIIISHRCTINDNHMMYGSWYTECNKQNFLSFGPLFALLPP